MRRSAIAALFFAVLAISPLAANAQTMEDCFQATTRPDNLEIIRICTLALERGQLNQGDRSAALSNRGLGHLRNKEYDKSIIDFSDSLLIDSKNAYAFNSRGDAWLQMSGFDRAFADFNEALRVDPTFTGALYNRGLAFERQGETSNARAEYRKAIATKGTRALDNWARDRAQERLSALGDTPPPQQKQQPREQEQRNAPEQKNTGRGSDGSYRRGN